MHIKYIGYVVIGGQIVYIANETTARIYEYKDIVSISNILDNKELNTELI